MANEALSIEVVHADTGGVWSRRVSLVPGACVSDALKASGFWKAHPQYPPQHTRVGVYGKECGRERLLRDGDRVEVYRPLIFDPMESRRRRAAHKAAAARHQSSLKE